MKIRLYTDEEIHALCQSIFINGVKYRRQIEYDPLFKLWVIVMKHDLPELSAREIFARGGIDIDILHKKLPQRRTREWLDNYEKFGLGYFVSDSNYYSSIKRKPSLKQQIYKFVLNRLDEINEEKN